MKFAVVACCMICITRALIALMSSIIDLFHNRKHSLANVFVEFVSSCCTFIIMTLACNYIYIITH